MQGTTSKLDCFPCIVKPVNIPQWESTIRLVKVSHIWNPQLKVKQVLPVNDLLQSRQSSLKRHATVKITEKPRLHRGVRQRQTADLQTRRLADLQTCDKLLLDARIRKYLMLIFHLESPQQTLSH